MAREKVDNKLNVVIGTKAQVEADNTIPDNSIVIVTDEEYIVIPLEEGQVGTSTTSRAISALRLKELFDYHYGVKDVSNDNILYGRMNGEWVEIESGGGGTSPWTLIGSRSSNGSITIDNPTIESYTEIRVDVIPILPGSPISSDTYFIGDSTVVPAYMFNIMTEAGLPPKSQVGGVVLRIRNNSISDISVMLLRDYTLNTNYNVTGLPSGNLFEISIYGR